MQRLIVEEEELVDTDVRYTEVEYGEIRFGVEYDAKAVGTPEVLLAIEQQQKFSEQQAHTQIAQGKLKEKAATYKGVSEAEAMERAKKFMPNVAREADAPMSFDLSSTSRILARLVTWIGLTSSGKELQPTEEFFRGKHFDFHGAIIAAIFEDFNRPINALATPLPEPSSQTVSEVSSPSSTAASEPPSLQVSQTTAS